MSEANRPTPDVIATLADELPLGIWVARAPGGELLYANRKFNEILGVAARDDVALGEYAVPYGIHDREGNLYPEGRMPFVRALTEKREVVVDDIVIHRHDGERVYIRATARPSFDDGGEITHIVIAFSDISREARAELGRAESELRMRQAERMESIGNLAGGIAHDFNNLLMVVKALAESLRTRESDPQKLEDLKTIDDMTESGAALTSSLLRFSGFGVRGTVPVPLTPTVKRIAELMKRTVDRRIAVSTDLSATKLLMGDESELEQIVMNLAINACDAMLDGGSLTLRTWDEESAVVLEVVDTGHGIPAALRARIFEPYFSTKTTGPKRGTGLGLATVHGIVQRYGAAIDVAENEPRGARMRVMFPACSDDGQSVTAAVEAEPSRGSGKLLVVDDEHNVRSATCRLVETMGYEALEAESGARAVEIFRARRHELRGVLLDLSMPTMDGRATFLALREIDPDVRVVLTTGHSLDPRAESLIELGIAAYIAKPFGGAELSRVLARKLR